VSAGKKKSRAMPFLAMLGDGSPKARAAFERNARMALKHPTTLAWQPGLKEMLERYLENPIRAAQDELQGLLDQRAALRQGRPLRAKNKSTLRLEKQFDVLYGANRDCSAEEIRLFKARRNIRRMSRAAVARHWSAAKKRSKK
jgi:hypothetical protein